MEATMLSLFKITGVLIDEETASPSLDDVEMSFQLKSDAFALKKFKELKIGNPHSVGYKKSVRWQKFWKEINRKWIKIL